MQPPGHREQKNKDALGGGRRRDLLKVTLQFNCQRTEGLPPGFMLCMCISCLSKKGYGKPKRGTMKKMPPNSSVQSVHCRIYMVFENDSKNHHVFCFALKSIILTVGNRKSHDFIHSYMYTLLTANPFHI